IAGGIKGIVEAAGEDALKGVNGANDDNADAGKIFATTGVLVLMLMLRLLQLLLRLLGQLF
ncbi:hypothetical protein VSX39_04930, partial (plasmid) [Borreliella burgdorferi]|uniref:hypothetical protein n=1 Tax=Borreliella burgdorferi TaxID=139 RepID=UPI003DA643EB